MKRVLTIAGVAALVLCLLAPAAASAAPLSSWRTTLSGSGGSASITTSPSGGGTLKVTSRNLVPRASYAIGVYAKTCATPGARVVGVPATKADAKGRITRSYTLSEDDAQAIVENIAGANLRLGSGSRLKCGYLAPVDPKNVAVGVTARVAGNAYAEPQLMTVAQAETWSPPADSWWKPDPGNAFITVLVRTQALGGISYNPYYFKLRDSSGFEYNHTIGRDPSLNSGDLAAGDTVQGWLTFEVPVASVDGTTLTYSQLLAPGATFRLGTLSGAVASPSPAASPAP